MASLNGSHVLLARIGGSAIAPDQINLASDRLSATLSFSSPMLPGNWKLKVFDTVVDDAGNALDGNANLLADDPSDDFQAAFTIAAIPGDANYDNTVDASDAQILSSHWGRSGMTWRTAISTATARSMRSMRRSWRPTGATVSVLEGSTPITLHDERLMAPCPPARSVRHRLMGPGDQRKCPRAVVPPLASQPSSEQTAAASDNVLAAVYGPQQSNQSVLHQHQLAWANLLARRSQGSRGDNHLERTDAVDLLLAFDRE